MTIKEKINQIVKDRYYNFIGIRFDVYDTDLIRIFDKVDGSCLFSCNIKDVDRIPSDLLNKEFKKSELIKLPRELFSEKHSDFAICFYLDAPDIVEKPINARMIYR